MLARAALLLAVLPVLAGLSACDTTTVTAFLERTWVPGASAAYTGKVTPAPAGSRVAVQRLVGASWVDVGTAGVAADGTYRVTLPNPGAATYRQRVVARSASGSQLAQSGESAYGHPADGTVSAPIANWLRGRNGSASVAIYDATTGVTSYYGTNQRYFCASIAKVSILGTVLRRAAVQNRALTATEKAHAVPMITQSSNDDATWLWNSVGGAPAVHAFQSSVGTIATIQDAAGRWGLATTTAADQARIVESVVWNNPLLRPADQAYARSLMRSVTSSQHWGISAGAPSGATVELKNGWLPHDGAYRVNSIGHVYDATHNYVIAVLTSTPGVGTSSFNYGIATIQGVTRALWGQNPTSSATAKALVAPDTSDAGR
jgi:beta-lactamase class A